MTARSMGGPFIVDSKRYEHFVFTTEEADGAIPNGTMIRKSVTEPGDATPYGTVGVVVGSIEHDLPLPDDDLAKLPRAFRDTKYAYFIEWVGRPDECIGVMDKKIEEV